MNKKITIILNFILLITCALSVSLSYYKNPFHIAGKEWFSNFQNDSNSLVLGKIASDKFGLQNSRNIHLGRLYIPSGLSDDNGSISETFINDKTLGEISVSIARLSEKKQDLEFSINQNELLCQSQLVLEKYIGGSINIEDQTRRISGIKKIEQNLYLIKYEGAQLKASKESNNERIKLIAPEASSFSYAPYTSGFGLQGIISSFLVNKIHLSLKTLYKINSILLAFSILFISIIFYKQVSKTFGIIFLITCFLSPWLTAIGRNLYWSAYSWFLPVILAFLITIVKNKFTFILIGILLFLSYFFKMLMGYEFLSSIVIFSTSLAFFKFITNLNIGCLRGKYFRILLLIVGISIIAFITSLFLQAYYKADDLIEGLKLILYDAQKRTFGDAKNYDSIFADSLNGDYLTVLKFYFLNWSTTDLIPGLSGQFFLIFIMVVFFLLCFYGINDYKIRICLGFYCYLLLVPVSWFLLAKPHSYIHTHINYVLFYLGFIPVLIYSSILILRKFLLDSPLRIYKYE